MLATVGLALGLIGAGAGSASAAMTGFGANLSSATPTLDTANGATRAQDEEPLSLWNQTNKTGDPNADEGISTSYASSCTADYPGDASTNYPGYTGSCTPWMHSGADNTVWNTAVPGGSPAAAQGGQVLEVDVKGCTVEDNSAGNTQQSPAGNGTTVPSNLMQFQALTPNANGSYTPTATAGTFQLPWCSDSANPADSSAAVNTSTITKFTPIHLCVSPGSIVSFYDVGGSVPDPSGGLFYPQGAPFDVIASVPGASTDSFTDADAAGGSYAPGAMPRGNNSGWGSEAGHEVMLSAVEGTGDNAYGLCPGGDAVEPANSNTVTCVTRKTNPGDPYPTCGPNDTPISPPQDQTPPTITGTAAVGKVLGVTHGQWTNSPYTYTHQWERCDSGGANCTAISGATGNNYKVTAADSGHTIEVAESATNDANTEGPVSSKPTVVIGTAAGGGGGRHHRSHGRHGFRVGTLRASRYAFRAAAGTVIHYNDSKRGTATLTLTRRGGGRVLVTLTHHDRRGRNTVALRDPALGKGFYRLRLSVVYHGHRLTDSVGLRVVH